MNMSPNMCSNTDFTDVLESLSIWAQRNAGDLGLVLSTAVRWLTIFPTPLLGFPCPLLVSAAIWVFVVHT